MRVDAELADWLAEHGEDPLLALDEHARAVFASRRFRERLGAPADARDLDALLSALRPADRDAARAALCDAGDGPVRVRLRVGPGSPRLELEVRRADGLRLARLRPVSLADPATDAPVDPLRCIADHLQSALWLVDVPAGRLLYVSAGFESVWGRSREDVLHTPEAFFDTLHAEDRERVRKVSYASWETGFEEEFRILLPDGETRWVHHRCVAVRDERGVVTASVGVSEDVDARRNAEEARRGADERLRVVGHSGFETITEMDESGRITWVGPRAWDAAFLRQGERPEPRPDLIHPEDRGRTVREILSAVRDERSILIEFRVCWPDGGQRWIETTVGPYRTGRGEKRALMMSRDVTQRRQMVERLRESEERYRRLVEDSPEGIFVVTGDEIVYVNPAGARLVAAASADALLGSSALDLLSDESRGEAEERLRELIAGQRWHEGLELRVRRLDGEIRDVSASGTRITWRGRPAVQSVVLDVTERRREELERQRLHTELQEAHKLESLGVLAGGIAHDFNNLLAVMLTNARFALGLTNAHGDAAGALRDAIEAAEGAARLTRQLLAYAGRRAPEVRAVDVSERTRAVRELLETAVPGAIAIELDLADGLPAVRVDVVQLEQVTMNLLFNAVEAIGDAPGRIRIATGRAEVPASLLAGWIGGEGLAAGEYVHLEVGDTGCGIAPDRRERMFDPFFTTKTVGHGLGLSAVLGFVRAHGGGVEVESRIGAGTTLRVWLPAGADALS